MEYRIDYDRIDVADIMAQVKMKVAERPAEPEARRRGRPFPRPRLRPGPGRPAASPPARGWKGRAKKAVRFLVRPYLPVLIPLDERFKFRTTLEVYLRIDEAVTDLMKTRDKLQEGLSDTRMIWHKLGTTRETVKLLHNLRHNLVVGADQAQGRGRGPEEQGPGARKGARDAGAAREVHRKEGLRMKLAFVVQRYGAAINGGAELHCRWIAEHLSRHAEVEVLTTRADDYITWKNHYRRGREIVNGVPVRRFGVSRPRRPERFGRIQEHVFRSEHRLADELRWLDEEGPRAPGLIRHIRRHAGDYDHFVFFSYRYYHSYWGIRAVPEKSVLVPTAECDPVVRLRIFRDLFRLPRALIYNSVEERAMINRASGNDEVPGDIVGVGSVVPAVSSGERFRAAHGVAGDYVLYVGRIDENKGCPELFRSFLRFKSETGSPVRLVLVGKRGHPGPGPPRHPSPGVPPGAGQVRRARRRPRPRHAVPLREPEHGHARGLGDGEARSGQRPL